MAIGQGRFFLLYSALGRLHLKYCIKFWDLQCKKDMDLMDRVQTSGMKTIEELVHPIYWEGLRARTDEPRQEKAQKILSLSINT